MAQIWKLHPPLPPHRCAAQGPPGRSLRRGGEWSPSRLPLPTGSSPDEEQFYTRMIQHNPRPPGAGDCRGVTALLQGVQGCWVLCWLGSALLVIKDTRLGFGRLFLSSGYPLGSASLRGGGGQGPPPCPLPAQPAPSTCPGSSSAPAALAGRKVIKGFCFKYIENKRGK